MGTEGFGGVILWGEMRPPFLGWGVGTERGRNSTETVEIAAVPSRKRFLIHARGKGKKKQTRVVLIDSVH